MKLKLVEVKNLNPYIRPMLLSKRKCLNMDRIELRSFIIADVSQKTSINKNKATAFIYE